MPSEVEQHPSAGLGGCAARWEDYGDRREDYGAASPRRPQPPSLTSAYAELVKQFLLSHLQEFGLFFPSLQFS